MSNSDVNKRTSFYDTQEGEEFRSAVKHFRSSPMNVNKVVFFAGDTNCVFSDRLIMTKYMNKQHGHYTIKKNKIQITYMTHTVNNN